MLFVFTRSEHMRIPSLFNEVRIALSFVFCSVILIIVFVVLLSFFFWPLCASFELRPLITPLHLHNVIANWEYTQHTIQFLKKMNN
jgi:hypothetical protein